MSAESSVGLLGLGAYTPERVMRNADWAAYVDTTDEWIVQRTGIERRRIAAEDETTADLALAAARRALADAGLGPLDVDELIVATDTPEVYIPDTASFVQHRLGARHVPAYDLAGSGCAGFLQALDVACSRVRSGKERVLVIGVEVISRLIGGLKRWWRWWRGPRAAAPTSSPSRWAAPAGRSPSKARSKGSTAAWS
jgi:3-oxoacyl-[acyl-carrier-protein] synthase-3